VLSYARFHLMKLRVFVTGSSAALLLWLGVTFVSTVPVQNYPQLGRGSVPVSAQRHHPATKPLADAAAAPTAPAPAPAP
jgi:hypothetical protein